MIAKVRVRRVKHGKGTPRKRHWRVEQDTVPGSMRVFIYRHHFQAIFNAQRLAQQEMISTFGLRGFHIEGIQP